ncbi:MAG: hypothetical protein HY898_08650 [Deltaproteobacteria bacterium]|nr:hypothetical protein [Deltaproteobacteria bacterium]
MKRSCAPFVAILLVGVLHAARAEAQSGSGGGAAGRVAGDLGLQADLGCALAGGDTALFARATVRYLQTAGIYATYLDGLRERQGPSSRSVSLGIELRPLFLPRSGLDLERGPAWLDLLVDSISLRLGAVVSRQPHYEPIAPGLEAGLGIGLPLTRSASGPWIDASAAIRLSDAQLAHRDGFELDRATVFTLTLGWQGIVGAHVVDAGDRMRR